MTFQPSTPLHVKAKTIAWHAVDLLDFPDNRLAQYEAILDRCVNDLAQILAEIDDGEDH